MMFTGFGNDSACSNLVDCAGNVDVAAISADKTQEEQWTGVCR